jgi:truncated hemoglobin YjbI
MSTTIIDDSSIEKKQFITTDIKLLIDKDGKYVVNKKGLYVANTELMTQLANMARGDAHHDLDEVFKKANYENDDAIKDAFIAGIPAKPTTYYDEPTCLSSVILSFNGTKCNGKIDDFLNNLRNVKNVTDGVVVDNTSNFTTIDVGFSGNRCFTYDAVQFIIECSTNAKAKLEPYKGDNFGNDFFQRVSLGGRTNSGLGTNASIIVDFSQHHFIEKLGQGTRSNNTNTIYYLMTPEVVNDPAGKTNIHNKSVFENKNGVKLVSCLQNTPNPMSYTKYNPFETNPLNNFFSNYDFSLLPIKQVFTGVKNEKLISTLNINYDRGETTVPFTDTIEDSKGENSITTVLGYLKSIIQKLQIKFGNDPNGVNKKANLQFNFNSKVQQKRGGDWFQVLACLDAKNRTYTQILPGNSRQQINNSVLGPVYFVTHDQIAVSYALLNGANVIYMDYYGRIYVFKNRGDPIFAKGATPIEKLLLNGMKDFWLGPEISTGVYKHENLKNHCIEIFDIYKKERTRLISNYKVKVVNVIEELSIIARTTFKDLKWEKSTSTKVFTNVLKKLFSSSVELAFVCDNFADINVDIAEINNEYDSLLKNVISDSSLYKEKIIQLNTNLNILKGLYDKFGDIHNTIVKEKTGTRSGHELTDPISTTFDSWIDKNVKKLDVYKAIDKLDFYNYYQPNQPDNNNLSRRFVNLFFTPTTSSTPDKTTDKHIFLTYIQTLDDKSVLNNIVKALTEIKNILGNTVTTLKETTRETRRNNLKPGDGTIYINNLLNLMYETILLLTVPPHDNDSYITKFMNVAGDINYHIGIDKLKRDIEGVLNLESTDNIIVKEDKDEIAILNGVNGKNSTSTMFVDDSSSSSSSSDADKIGGGWKTLVKSTSSSGNNVICDVSVKQITWQLLNCILLEGCSLTDLKTILDNYKKYMIPVRPQKEEEIDYFSYDEFVKKITDSIEEEEQEDKVIQFIQVSATVIGVVVGGLTVLYNYYLPNKLGSKHGGGNPDDTTDNLLQNFNMGYHPLMPIYMLLSPFYYTLGPKAQGDPFFYTYFTYFNVLEKMVDVLENNYLNEPSNNSKILSSYVIGFALRTFLFTSNTSNLQSKKILQVVGIPLEDFSTFSLKNDSFSNLIMGTFHSNPDEDIAAFILLDSDLFNNFINNEVNIKNILQQGTQVDNLPTYNVLKDKIYNLLSRIVSKINIDRGTPETVETSEIVASLPQVTTNVDNNEIQNPQEVAKGVLPYKPYINPAVEAQKTVWSFTNGFNNTGISVGAYGGKTKKYRKNRNKHLKSNKNKKRTPKQKSKTRKIRKNKYNKNTKRFKKQ